MFLAPGLARAEAVLATNSYVYAVASKSNIFLDHVSSKRLGGLMFVELGRGPGDGWNAYALSGPRPIGDFEWLPKRMGEKGLQAVGCARYPKEWMVAGKRVARLAKPLPKESHLLALPAKMREISPGNRNHFATDAEPLLQRATSMSGRGAECADRGRFFADGDTLLAVCAVADDLNMILFVLRQQGKDPWRVEERFTVSENCP